ncbi:MAG: NUDIX hydrolase [Thaumarchaeota archaeon]|nr:NUDIX hydrolase [Nitrososphaerota archaeon]MDG6905544.1 NUDIX hydrolase [Nitrososphaerota archaeon]
MTEERRFADFYDGALPFQMSSIPEGGMCLSVFLVLWKEDIHHVLLGKVNKEYDWIGTGALNKESAARITQRWMLPSSHLLLYESPKDAARRVLKEQLGLDAQPLEGPFVYSEVYDAPKYEIKNHWDMEFVFTGKVSSNNELTHPAWSELKFLNVAKLPESEFARSHQDILVEIGAR